MHLYNYLTVHLYYMTMLHRPECRLILQSDNADHPLTALTWWPAY